MNSSFKPLNLDDGLHRFHAHGPERTGRKAEETPGTALRWFADELKQAVHGAAGWISHWRQRRAAIRELQGLNDHYLKDIGLERSEITSAVDGLPENGGHPAAITARRHQTRW